jgi:hypothetical protein
LRDGVLVISSFGKSIEVPLSEIEKATASRFSNPELIKIRFRSPTAFGSKITFIPPIRYFHGFSRHPLAAELTALAEQSAAQPDPNERFRRSVRT